MNEITKALPAITFADSEALDHRVPFSER